MNSHTVRPNDTLGSIARKHTGDSNRWGELLGANPNLSLTPDGRLSTWREGMRLALPSRWAGNAPVGLAGVPGQVGLGAGAIKDYYYREPDNGTGAKLGMLYSLAAAWTGGAGSRFKELYDVSGPGTANKKLAASAGNDYQPGDLFAIPSSWPEPTDPTIIARLVNTDGTPWTGKIEAPECPPGTHLDNNQCVPDSQAKTTTTTVNTTINKTGIIDTTTQKTETGTSWKTWLLYGGIAVAAVGLGALAYVAYQRRQESAPPAAPPELAA
jgi:hypothetical protein